MDELEGSPVQSKEELTGLVFYSLLAAASALIPIPLLDDWSYSAVRRRMVRDIFSQRGTRVEGIQLGILLGQYDPGRSRGCLYQAFFALVVLPLRILSRFVRDLFRKILIFLAVKQASEWASVVFHEGYLLRCGAAKLPEGAGLGRTEARRIRYAVRLSLRGLNTSPVWNVFYGIIRLNRSLMRSVASHVSRLGKQGHAGGGNTAESPVADEYLQQERRLLEDVVNRLADLLAGQRGYLKNLESRFERFYGIGSPQRSSEP
jgi:hypothetical protein